MLASQQIRRPLLVGLLASSAGMAAARVQTKTVTDDGDVVFSPEVAEEENGFPKVADGAVSTPLSSSTVQVQGSDDKKEANENKEKAATLTQEFGDQTLVGPERLSALGGYTDGWWLMNTFTPPYRFYVPQAMADAGPEAIAEYSKVLAHACKNETEIFYFVAQAMAEVYMVLTNETSIEDDPAYSGQFARLIKTVLRFENDDWKMFKGQKLGVYSYSWSDAVDAGVREQVSWGKPNMCWEPCVGAMEAASGQVETRFRKMSNLDKELALEMMVGNYNRWRYMGHYYNVVDVLPDEKDDEKDDAKNDDDDDDDDEKDAQPMHDINTIGNARKKAKAIRETFKQFSEWYNKLLDVMFQAVKSRVAEEFSNKLKPLPKDEQARVQRYSEIATASVASGDGSDSADQEKKKEKNGAKKGKKQKKEEGHETADDKYVPQDPVQHALNAEDYDRDWQLENEGTKECKVFGRQMYKLGRVMGVVQEMLSPNPHHVSARPFLMHPLALKKVRELSKDKYQACRGRWDGQPSGIGHYSNGIDDAEKNYYNLYRHQRYYGPKDNEAGKKHLLKAMNTKLDATQSETMMKILGDGFISDGPEELIGPFFGRVHLHTTPGGGAWT